MKSTRRAQTAPAAKQGVPNPAKSASNGKRPRPGRPKRTDQEVEHAASAERLAFARNLRRSRRWLEISQEEMALRAGMSRSYVSGVELGERNISLDNMARLAAVLELPLHRLLEPNYTPGPVPGT